MLGSPDSLLVVGGGAAGHECVTAYRDGGGDRPVLILSADDRPPYFRPHVSKDLLAGEVVDDDLFLADPGWYAGHDVEVLTGCEVEGLDLGARLATTRMGPAAWWRLVLATGSGSGSLPVPGIDEPGVMTLRAAADTEHLLARLERPDPVVIVGSGFIGCEAAAGLRQRGHDVTVVSAEARPQEDRLGPPVGELLTGWLGDAGVGLRGGRQVEAIERHGEVLVVRAGDDPPLEAAVVLLAVGAVPRTSLADDAGLGGEDGVEVDARMRTAAEDVLAVGDIAAAWHHVAGRRLRVEHWGDAVEHGRIAGETLAGRDATWSTVPGFWSTIAGNQLEYVAWGDGHDEVRVDRSSSGITVWYGRDGVVVGVLTHGHPEDQEQAQAAVARRRPMPTG